MYEILAIAAGVVLGLMAQRLLSTPLKIGTVVLGSIVIGVLVSSFSGELSISWAFLVFDIGQVLIAAAVAMVLSAVWRHQRSRV